MKRLLVVTLIALMAASLLVGCKASVYKDGTYTALSDATNSGYMKAEVTVQKDKITAVKLYGYNNLGLEKPASYQHAEYHKVLSDMPSAMVTKNSWQVDVIAKATGSSNQSMQAVERAMQKAMVKPSSSAKYFDGTYMAISETLKNDKGWTIVWVTVANDTITDVVLHATTPAKEKDADGNVVIGEDGREVIRKDAEGNVVFERKTEAYPHAPYHEARTELKDRFVAKNGSEIDAYSGATSTSNQAKEAVAIALQRAQRK